MIHLWDAPPVVREYLETGDETKRAAAWAAAGAAAWDAAGAAAWEAAWDAAGRWQTKRLLAYLNGQVDLDAIKRSVR